MNFTRRGGEHSRRAQYGKMPPALCEEYRVLLEFREPRMRFIMRIYIYSEWIFRVCVSCFGALIDYYDIWTPVRSENRF